MTPTAITSTNGHVMQNGHSKHRIILDTDLAMGAGGNVDDGFALALAHADPHIQIDLITTVNGNTDVDSATLLTCSLADRLGLDAPIVSGAATPFTRPDHRRKPSAQTLEVSRGSRTPSPGYAAMAIISHVMGNPGEITIMAIGPLTNIAIALSLEPKLARAIRELVIMGGLFNGSTGSSDKPGETNVFTDPEAARAVLRSGIPQRWVGLDVTRQCRMTKAQAQTMAQSPHPFSSFAGEQASQYIDRRDAMYPGEPQGSCCIHDALAVAVVSRPDICEFRQAAVSIIAGEGEGRGIMITDRLEGVSPPKPNCRIAVSVNVDAFYEHFSRLYYGPYSMHPVGYARVHASKNPE